jgi:hypothetical protein
MRLNLFYGTLSLALLLGSSPTLLGHSFGAPPGVTGAPGDGLCTQCHIGTANSNGGSLMLSVLNGSTWTPGQPLNLKVTLADPTAMRWGFELTARLASATSSEAGTFTLTQASDTQIETAGSLQFVTHTTAGTKAGTTGSSTWEVAWNPPTDLSAGTVTFYAAGNAANNSGTPIGDHIYTTSLNVNAASASPSTTSMMLPQLAFGGGWYTALYLYNSTTAAVSVPISFFDKNGQPLAIPNGGTTTTVNLAANGTGFVEALNSGTLQQGWIQAGLPDGVVGYGVFRQHVDGQVDQEAVVPISGTSSTLATIIFDDTNYITAIAYANPSSTTAAITITARDASGNVIGTTTDTLPPGEREAERLRDISGLSGVAGQRGIVEIKATTGAIALLGLRFNGLAFTSIPATEK